MQNLRINTYDRFTLDFIKQHHYLESAIPSEALRLFTTNQESKYYNEQRLQAMDGRFTDFYATDSGPAYTLKDTALLRMLRLKINTPVMLLHNLDVSNGWTNGTRCIVTAIRQDFILVNRLSDNQPFTIFRITRDVFQTPYSRTQFPLVPSFSSTIHKVQSLTLEGGVAISLTLPMRSFGQLYVACSRVRSENQIFFFGKERSIKAAIDLNNQEFITDLGN